MELWLDSGKLPALDLKRVSKKLRQHRIITVVLIAVLSLTNLLDGAGKSYENGKLVSIESPDTPFPVPLPPGPVIGVPINIVDLESGKVTFCIWERA